MLSEEEEEERKKEGIIDAPRSANVSLNGVAEFTCTAVADTFVWEANGVEIDEGMGNAITLLAINETVSIRRSLLRLMVSSRVSSTDNAANITCTAISLSPFSKDDSDPALLLVQGLLEPVSDLTVDYINSTTVLISWSPPFTLEGVPILSYNVTITNTTSGENETMSVEGDTTMLYYSIDHPDPDNNFTVTVVPINGAGPGEDVFKFIQIQIPTIMTTTEANTGALIYSTAASVSSTASSSTSSNPIPTPDRDNNQITALVVIPVTITTISCAIVLIAIFSIVTVVTCCLVLTKRRLPPPQDVVPVSANPAYEQVTLKSVAVQENSAYSIVHTVSPPAAAVAEYENIAGLQHTQRI